jgi:hypothetical protein
MTKFKLHGYYKNLPIRTLYIPTTQLCHCNKLERFHKVKYLFSKHTSLFSNKFSWSCRWMQELQRRRCENLQRS